MKNSKNTHRLDYIHRHIPAFAGRAEVSEDYIGGRPLDEVQQEIRDCLHLYAPGTTYILFRLEGSADSPLYLQPLNMLSLDYPEPGPGLCKPLSDAPDFIMETAKEFWKHAEIIPAKPLPNPTP